MCFFGDLSLLKEGLIHCFDIPRPSPASGSLIKWGGKDGMGWDGTEPNLSKTVGSVQKQMI